MQILKRSVSGSSSFRSLLLILGVIGGVGLSHIPSLHAGGIENIRVVNSRWPDSSSMEAFARDAIRLMEAETDEEKALAIFRFIRMTTSATNGKVPREPALGDKYIDDPLKVLNVYGAHHCDGLSRMMEWSWRSLGGRAEKLYRSGHTQADVFYEDGDGEKRWHLFDLSQGWYVYDRSDEHIATPDEIAGDFSLIFRPSGTPKPARPHYWGMWNWVHAPHVAEPSYSPDLRLRRGEKVVFLWGNEKQPYQNNYRKKGGRDFEHGPYPVTYGNAVFTYTPSFDNRYMEEDTFRKPVNLLSSDGMDSGFRITPLQPGRPAELVYEISSPYIIADAAVSGEFFREDEQDSLSILISTDRGDTWHPVWKAEETGKIVLNGMDICRKFNIYKSGKEDMTGTPFGRYGYLVKFSMEAEGSRNHVALSTLEIRTTVQHNIFSLPQLWPGKNVIQVKGKPAEDLGLEVSFAWQDLQGKDRRNSVWIGKPPYKYEILAAGKKWEDVRCKTLAIEVRPGKLENASLKKEKSASNAQKFKTAESFATSKIVGRRKPGALKDSEVYVKKLQTPGKQVQALAALMAQRDRQTFDPVLELALSTRRFPQKDMAVQALYLIDPDRAIPVYMDILRMDPRVRWKKDKNNEMVRLGHWYIMSALVGTILAEAGEVEAVPHLIKVLESSIKHDSRDWGSQGAIIRSLGRLDDPSAAPVIRHFLNEKVDVAARAVEALGRLGDADSIPAIRKLFLSSEYKVLTSKAAIALGRLGDKSVAPQLRDMLESGDENLRAAGAGALGEIGEDESLDILSKALDRERHPWVRAVMEKGIEKIRRRARL